MVSIIGKEKRGNDFDFFVQIGNNYHRVTDCGQQLAQMLNTHLDGVGFTGEKTLKYAMELKQRPDLSCHSSRLDKPVYLDNFTTYYFSTGETGEYYSIKRDCGYPFYSTLFQLENRVRIFNAPRAQKLIKLSCDKTSASVGDYALYFVEEPRAGGMGGWVIVLCSKQQQPARIVISKLDGQYLKEVARDKINSLIQKLNRMNYGVKPLTYFPKKLLEDEPWFEICVDNKCKGKTLAQLAQEKTNQKGESYQKLSFSNLRFMACDSLLSQLLPDKPLSPEPDEQSVDWFSAMQAEPSAATIFKCPTKVCERHVPAGDYTVNEFHSIVNKVAACETKSHLHVTLLGDVTIKGAKPIRIQSRHFKSITIESHTLTYEKTGEGFGDSVVFWVGQNKQFGLKNLKLEIETDKNRPLTAIIKASKAKLKLDNVSVRGSASAALKLDYSTVYCFFCQLEAQKYGIVAKDSQIFAHGNGLISGKGKHAIYFSGKSEAIVEGMTLEGNALLFIGTKSRALIDKAQLKPLSSVAFGLLSKRFPKEKGYALSIKNSQFVLENLQPTDFTMVKFHGGGDGSGNIEFVLDDKSVFDKSYLSCDGRRLGKLIFEGRDYCQILKNYRD
jgi:hypothetical protein